MTTKEFSNEFDTLLNSNNIVLPYGTPIGPILFDEYEKSVFLTKAQEDLVISLYSTDIGNQSFESTEELRQYLSSLVRTLTVTKEKSSDTMQKDSLEKPGIQSEFLLDRFKHSLFTLPDDLWFMIYELAVYTDSDACINNLNTEIVPIQHDTYNRTIRNPFRGPTKNRVLRLDIEGSTSSKVELVSKYEIKSYIIRYLRKPTPIILEDLEAPLTINGLSTAQTCQLNTVLHRRILELAVQMALLSKVGQLPKNTKQN